MCWVEGGVWGAEGPAVRAPRLSRSPEPMPRPAPFAFTLDLAAVDARRHALIRSASVTVARDFAVLRGQHADQVALVGMVLVVVKLRRVNGGGGLAHVNGVIVLWYSGAVRNKVNVITQRLPNARLYPGLCAGYGLGFSVSRSAS